MELGRLDDETTANVGVIAGGVGLERRRRALPDRGRGALARRDEGRRGDRRRCVDACTWAASEHGCDVDVDVTEIFRGYRQRSGSPAVRLAREALERCGIEPREVATGRRQRRERADRTRLRLRCCSPTAPTANHTPQESVGAARLVEMLAVCEAIAELAATAEA